MYSFVAGLFILLIIIPFVAFPFFVFAQGPPPPPPDGDGNGDGGDSAPDTEFPNPVKSDTFGKLITKLAKIITVVGMPFVVFFLLLSGFYFVTAQGNEQQVEKAKKILFWTVIGAAIIVGAWAIATAIDNFGKSLS